MRNFRKVAVRVLVVLVAVCLFEGLIRFCYEPWNEYTIVSRQERTDLKGTIDTLYCGTSIAYRAFCPEVFDEKLGTISFNLATAAQPTMGIYYLIRETVEENPVKRIYLGLTIPVLKGERYDIRYVSAYENLRTWKWRLLYLASLHNEKVISSALLYSTRVKVYTAKENVKKNVYNKWNHVVSQKYGERGYRNHEGKAFDGDGEQENRSDDFWDGALGAAQVEAQSTEYLSKIADLCRQENIELYLIVPPPTQEYIDGMGDVDAFNRFCEEMAQELGATFYNFMLYKDRKEVFTNDKFKDINHFRDAGGRAFSDLLADIVMSDHPEDYFYSSIEDF